MNKVFNKKRFSMTYLYKILTIISLLILTNCSSLNRGERKERISKNFTLSEALKNDGPVDDDIYENILYTASRMEEVRSFLDSQLLVVSWYRNPAHNSRGGGARNSAHMKGLAVDFRAANAKDQRLIFNKIIKSKLSFDVIIYYKKQNFIHLGFKPEDEFKNEQQLIMTREY